MNRCKFPITKQLVHDNAISIPIIYLPGESTAVGTRKAAVLLHRNDGTETVLKVVVYADQSVVEALSSAADDMVNEILGTHEAAARDEGRVYIALMYRVSGTTLERTRLRTLKEPPRPPPRCPPCPVPRSTPTPRRRWWSRRPCSHGVLCKTGPRLQGGNGVLLQTIEPSADLWADNRMVFVPQGRMY